MSRMADEQQRIDTEAADWLAAIECGTADCQAFERWRSGDPARALAFIRASQVSAELNALRVAGLGEPASQPESMLPKPGADRRRFLSFAAAGVLAAGTAAFGWSFATAAHAAETAVGERRRIVVASGVAIELNTDSHIEWRNRDGLYDIRLLRGEVMLERQAGGEPCRLHCREARIDVAAGARVNARFRPERIDLSVLEGEATLQTAGATSAVRLTSLRKASVPAGAPPALSTISPVEAGEVSAWQQGQLYFNGKRLEEAVEEYNRYLSRPIEIADPSIRQLRLGGRFSSTDPGDFCRALEEIYSVSVRHDPDGIKLTRSDPV